MGENKFTCLYFGKFELICSKGELKKQIPFCKTKVHFEKVNSTEIQKNKDFIYELPKNRVKMQVKAVVLGILLHAERKSNLRLIFWDG